MKDKLYKTNKKVGFYRLRAALVTLTILTIVGGVFTLPYKYVVKAINAYQAEAAPEVEAPLVEDVVETL